MDGEWEAVQLQPFVHQVGGHSAMLMFDATLCKPLIMREYKFYNTLPKVLRDVTPEYRGVVEVSYEENSVGEWNLVARPCDVTTTAERMDNEDVKRDSYTSPSTSNESDAECVLAPVVYSPRQRNKKEPNRSLGENVDDANATQDRHVRPVQGPNPWNLRCGKRQLDKLKAVAATPQRFIMLENLACQFKLPCILDLKMGQRQHGDDVSEAKKQRHIKKCLQSTSHNLGFRVCGMQVYQAGSHTFLCHSKYAGRKLDEAGVRATLQQFLHNGKRMRVELVDGIMQKLEALVVALEQLSTFRFYSSSLLVMYDGGVESGANGSVSGAAAALNGSCQDQAVGSTSGEQTARDARCSAAQHHQHSGSLVDVRMIDFAHATHSGFEDDVTRHDGPDRSYVFGLRNLMTMFGDVKRQHAPQ